MNTNTLADIFRQALAHVPVSDGITTQQLQAEMGVGNNKILSIVRSMREDGLIEPVPVAKRNVCGHVTRITGWRATPKALAMEADKRKTPARPSISKPKKPRTRSTRSR